MTDGAPFKCVFLALRELIARGHAVTVLVGNHDVELCLPAAQEALLKCLGADRRQLLFVDDGRAYRIGRALIEHGNRYDKNNRNDWAALRAIASAQSRNEPEDEIPLIPSPGSQLVEKVINPLKAEYPFIDLLQPESLVQVLLIKELDLRVRAWFDLIGQYFSKAPLVLETWIRRRQSRTGDGPTKPGQIAASGDEELDPELIAVFGDDYRELMEPIGQIGWGDNWPPLPTFGRDKGLFRLLADGKRAQIGGDRLARIREALRRELDSTETGLCPVNLDGLALRARELIKVADCDVVVMGHTHEEREYFWGSPPGRASYINTGAWADVIRIPPTVLEKDSDELLLSFLEALMTSARPISPPTFGELRVEADGRVTEARCRRHEHASR